MELVVAHDEVSRRINCHSAARLVKSRRGQRRRIHQFLATRWALALNARYRADRSRGSYLADDAVLPIRNVDVSVRAGDHAERRIELIARRSDIGIRIIVISRRIVDSRHRAYYRCTAL